MRANTINLVTADRPIGVMRLKGHRDTALHRHDNVELAVVTAGSGEHATVDGAWTIERGDVLVIPVDMEHGYARCRDLALINIGFDTDRAGLPAARLARLPGWHALAHLEPRLRARHEFASHLRLGEEDLALVLGWIDRLEDELRARRPGHDLACAGLLTQILVACARCYAAAETPAARALVRLAELLAWLDGHSTRPVRIDDLARRARMSPSTLGRLFRRCLGRSPLDYVIDLRLRIAAERLRDGVAIAAAAKEAGFADANYFARRFRACYGCSPREWRAQTSNDARGRDSRTDTNR